jgi:hypothetical protein
MKSVMPLFASIALAFLLSGCSALQYAGESVSQSPIKAHLITNQLTMRFIAQADNPAQRANKVRAEVSKLRQRLNGQSTSTLATIDTFVRKQIDWQGMRLADQEALDFALAEANKTLQSLIGDGAIDADGRVTIDTLLTWIDNAAIRVR